MNKKVLLITLIVLFIMVAGGFLLQSNFLPSEGQSATQTGQSSNNTSQKSDETELPRSDSFIEQLRSREFAGGEIRIEETQEQNNSYTNYLVSYPSDDLTIYASMNVPQEDGPFPVIVLNHGYYNPASFTSGDGTERMADILARNGYLTLASDYRGHGMSESDGQSRGGHRPEYAIDVLNLIASIDSIEKANANSIGMWGHSMGGEVSLRTIEATDKVKAVALWAPTSANATDNHAFYGGGRSPENQDPEVVGTSPINYLNYISAPISLHQGLEDTEVNPEWSEELKVALEQAGKTVKYFEYEGQDHNFNNLGWDLISERTIAFYDKYLK